MIFALKNKNALNRFPSSVYLSINTLFYSFLCKVTKKAQDAYPPLSIVVSCFLSNFLSDERIQNNKTPLKVP